MSDVIDKAVEAMREKFAGGFDGTVKFVIGEEGSVIVDEDGVRKGDDEAQVTLTAEVETFRAILEGDLSPTTAFMSGRLSIDGDMGLAMRLAGRMG